APYPFYVLFLMHRTIDSFLLYSLFLPITFFSSSFCYHRDLHSFPTRRSSDLGYAVRFMAYGGAMMVSSGNTFRCIDTSQEIVMRSEEHTSELQSRFDLVCRLLLEKKKKIIRKSLELLTVKRTRICRRNCPTK